jgi:tetratricopeptide (TPR) repeat protein
VIRELGRPEQAVEHLTMSLALHHEIGSQGGQTTVLETLGETYSDLGRLDDARELLTQALAMSRNVGDRYSEACELYALARRTATPASSPMPWNWPRLPWLWPARTGTPGCMPTR